MNYNLPFIPERPSKPRQKGLTMVMDKGLSINEVENLISSSGSLIDLAKIGFGTSYLNTNLKEKIKLYKQNNIIPYLGGTLFEVFYVRGMVDEYKKLIDEYNLDLVEISDGCMNIPHEEKLKLINNFAKNKIVISEVGSKDSEVIIEDDEWTNMMQKELKEGSWKVIAEARESGNVGIYQNNGKANCSLIDNIITKISIDDIIWEAPAKAQQTWFIKYLGANVNLGNISSNEVIALETLRLGLRGDTFFDFLPEEIKNKYK